MKPEEEDNHMSNFMALNGIVNLEDKCVKLDSGNSDGTYKTTVSISETIT